MKRIFKFSFFLLSVIIFNLICINHTESMQVTVREIPTYFSSNSNVDGGFDYEEWIDDTKKDVNNDGYIDALDLTELKKILLEPIDPESLIGDTNDSGEIDIRDLIYLKKYLSEN